jgi:hypothetical protein
MFRTCSKAARISSVDRSISDATSLVSLASDLISCATIVKPDPAGPARAASIWALSASVLSFPSRVKMALVRATIFSLADAAASTRASRCASACFLSLITVQDPSKKATRPPHSRIAHHRRHRNP